MPSTPGASERKSRGRKRGGTSFPATIASSELPDGYFVALGKIKHHIQAARLRIVMAANAAMVTLYWNVGALILERQAREGWAPA